MAYLSFFLYIICRLFSFNVRVFIFLIIEFKQNAMHFSFFYLKIDNVEFTIHRPEVCIYLVIFNTQKCSLNGVGNNQMIAQIFSINI